MDTDSFRDHAHRLVDWMADYMDGVEALPVRAQTRPGEIASHLPADPPEQGEAMADIFQDFQTFVVPGLTHWQHPGFFAYFPANASPPSILAEMLTATVGANCMLWETSPAGTEMETRMLDWVRRMTGLPHGLAGVIQDSASSAILCALLTARERATDWRANAEGLGAVPPLTVYTSEQAHSATEKGAKIAGYGRANLRLIESGPDFAMRPQALLAQIKADKAAGLVPACLVASLGTTGVGAFDPLRPLGEICRAEGLFFHVDAAWAGAALILPEERWMADGIELADSLVLNPHKWLMTNFDCSAHFVRDPDALTRTLAILPEYLKSREQGAVIDYRDWSVPLGRRFRALKLWFVIRSYGVEGLRTILRHHIALAREAEGWITAAPDFEIVAPRRLALFNFRYCPPGETDAGRLNALNEELLCQINDGGAAYFTRNLVGGMTAIRWSIGQRTTERRHVEATWTLLQETAAAL